MSELRKLFWIRAYILFFSEDGQWESCKIPLSSKSNVMRTIATRWNKWIVDQAHAFNFHFWQIPWVNTIILFLTNCLKWCYRIQQKTSWIRNTYYSVGGCAKIQELRLNTFHLTNWCQRRLFSEFLFFFLTISRIKLKLERYPKVICAVLQKTLISFQLVLLVLPPYLVNWRLNYRKWGGCFE